MKRRITTLLATLLLMLVALPASSQLAELKYKTVTISGEGAETMTPDTQWYLVWNKRVYLTQGGGYFEDKGAGQRAYLSNGTGVIADDEYATEKAQYLVRFLSTDVEGKYLIQFGTGNYLYIHSDQPYTTASESEAAGFNVYNIGGEASHFGINVWNMGYRIDQNGSGGTLATWGTGEITSSGGNNDFTIYPVDLSDGNELAYAFSQLNTCFGTYSDYLPDYGQSPIDQMRGTEIGQYNFTDEQLAAFVNSMEQALAILNDEVDNVTVEQIEKLIEDIQASYNAIMETLVTLSIQDGNYRIVSALEWTNTTRVDTGELDENDNPKYEEITTHPTKAMYATLEGNAMWANIDSTDCRYLWKLTNGEDGLIQLMNIATDGILHSCSQSTQAKLTTDSETMMAFEFIQRNEAGKVVIAMKPSSGGTYAYLHCNGHGGGSGTASNIVGWTAGAGASQWILEPVSDEEVQELVDAYAPIKNHELMVQMFQELLSEAEATEVQAKDERFITTRNDVALITETSQFSSPWTESSEGSFDNVLTDDASTFWHSAWSGGNVANHTHYFNVAFESPVEADALQCYILRRNVVNDHITALGVYGSNAEGALEDETEASWTNLGTFNLAANASSGLNTYSANTIRLPEAYLYFRFYIDGTTNGRGYGHFAKFQLYPAVIDGYTQWEKLGDSAAAFAAALAKAQEVDLDDIDMEDYEALKAALDAFKPLLANPDSLAALAAAIEANKDIKALLAFGENPGFWSETGNVGSLVDVINEASKYLKSGEYTDEKTVAYLNSIGSGLEDFFALANPVEEGQWYALRFGSEEIYDAHGWNKAGAQNATLGDLFDNYAAPANVETDSESQTSYLTGFDSLEEVNVGQNVRFISDETISEMDQVAFRFVAQGDSAYAIQHKSGLYLGGANRSTNLKLGLTPALFNVKAVGYGRVIIEARDLKGQGYYADAPVYLHAQSAGHSLVTWSNDAVDSSSALLIEPIEVSVFDEGEEAAEGVNMAVKPNSMVFMTYPIGFSVEGADIYEYQGAAPDSIGDGANYAFNKIEAARPGQPVLLVVGNTMDFEADDEEEEPELITLIPVGTSFAPEPLAVGGAHGTYAYQWVDEGTVVVGGGKIAQPGNSLVLAEGKEGTDCTRDIAANTGYIVYGENVLPSDTYMAGFDLLIHAGRPMKQGDVNNDAVIDVADAVSVLNIMAEGSNDPKADVNKDGKVDIADFVSILNIMAEQ